MNDIRAFVKKLRHAADVLDELFERPGTPGIANQIRASLTSAKPRKPLHWTKRPENAARVRAWRKKMAARRVQS